jgi:hypothetical protein
VKISTTALSERFECELVADSFNEHDRTQVEACGPPVCCRNEWSTRTVSRRSLLLVHTPYLHTHTRRPRPAQLEIDLLFERTDILCGFQSASIRQT